MKENYIQDTLETLFRNGKLVSLISALAIDETLSCSRSICTKIEGSNMKTILTTALLCSLACTAHADLTVTFSEGAPKDRFTFKNTAECALPATKLALDLAGSNGALVFDVTNKGAGVEVFQPFDLVSGKEVVLGHSTVSDGDKTLSIDISGLEAGEQVAFTIDVDDTIGQREITVNASEISGGTASFSTNSGLKTAAFEGNVARVAVVCPT